MTPALFNSHIDLCICSLCIQQWYYCTYKSMVAVFLFWWFRCLKGQCRWYMTTLHRLFPLRQVMWPYTLSHDCHMTCSGMQTVWLTCMQMVSSQLYFRSYLTLTPSKVYIMSSLSPVFHYEKCMSDQHLVGDWALNTTHTTHNTQHTTHNTQHSEPKAQNVPTDQCL